MNTVITSTDMVSIEVDGKPLQKAEHTRLFLYHKEDGLVTTASDERGRPTVFDKLPEGLPRLANIAHEERARAVAEPFNINTKV